LKFARLFKDGRQSDISLSGKEIAVLSIIWGSANTGICAADISTALAKEIGKEPRLSTIYSVIIKLEEKNLISSPTESQAETGGRPRRLFRPTEIGDLALKLGERMLQKGVLV
jgi:DNA-binding PadR family transcriptional regulator